MEALTMTPMQRDALRAMGNAGAVWTEQGWTWRQEVRESTTAAAAMLRAVQKGG
jgi:hypothetical protein